QRRGIALLPADVNASAVTCTTDGTAVRIGLGYVSGVRSDEVTALAAAREAGGPFRSLGDLASRAGAGRPALAQLAWAGACDSLSDRRASRREVLWELGVAAPGEPVQDGTQLSLPLDVPAAPALRDLEPWESMIADYTTTGLTLGRHPMALLREELPAGTVSCADLEMLRHEQRVRIGGLVVARQRPGTAKGIVFILIEDEFGTVNLIVPPPVYERHRLLVRSEPLLVATGRLEKLAIAGGAINIFVDDLEPLKAPQVADAEVVSLEERARREEEAADLADFRTVAPAVQSFGSGRRR
ncbi:MAG TPA: OB-fold nucleic acid binding domain-containing protein, partial [Solirubrobacteraceae bacterium]|nr:OB-fold nucleic acid binding domain-containing protein [Solirubrobacteraceae bacterium]